jgi:hypothetical protein
VRAARKWMEEMMQGQPPHDPQWSFEQNRAIAEQVHDRVFKTGDMLNEASVNGGNLALRMVLLINGGAAVALLSFMNALPKDQRQAIASALAWFAWGVVAAALALGLAYFTNRCAAGVHLSMQTQYVAPYVVRGPSTAKWNCFYWVFHIAAVLVGLASLVFFVVGMLQVKSAFINL